MGPVTTPLEGTAMMAHDGARRPAKEEEESHLCRQDDISRRETCPGRGPNGTAPGGVRAADAGSPSCRHPGQSHILPPSYVQALFPRNLALARRSPGENRFGCFSPTFPERSLMQAQDQPAVGAVMSPSDGRPVHRTGAKRRGRRGPERVDIFIGGEREVSCDHSRGATPPRDPAPHGPCPGMPSGGPGSGGAPPTARVQNRGPG
jgi:hypothetical protein